MITVRVGGTDELAALAHRLRTVDVGRDATGELRERGGSTLPRVQAAVRSIDIGSSRDGTSPANRSTGLRARLAEATRTKDIDGGVRLEVIGAEVDPVWGWRLAKLTDTELAPRWRHPVFFNEDREHNAWTGQTGQRWFFTTVRGDIPLYDEAMRRVVDRVAEHITEG